MGTHFEKLRLATGPAEIGRIAIARGSLGSTEKRSESGVVLTPHCVGMR